MLDQYEVLRVMNNNVILAKKCDTNTEVVLMGRGIGFGKKKGQEVQIAADAIEKSFMAADERLQEGYLDMLNHVSGDLVQLVSEVLVKAEQSLGKLSERSFVVILDHISFAIEKRRQNIRIENPFIMEIRFLYPKEYDVGVYARQAILDKIGIDITEAEVGFIALHLNAAKQHVGVTDTLKNTRIIKELVDIIEKGIGFSLDGYPRLYSRLMFHLKAFMQRVEEQDPGNDDHVLFEAMKKECVKAYHIATVLAKHVQTNRHVTIPESDVFYLTLHVDRLIRTHTKNEMNKR